ncbi:hypothetical protein [uncultured Nostoc sp.]|uniref:hypothetical protein n=1 Tax=uncultured Nostoc sp. TaxID=340711 RepID=UPI0035CCA67E
MVKGYKEKEDGERLKRKGETEAFFTPSSLNPYPLNLGPASAKSLRTAWWNWSFVVVITVQKGIYQ